MARPRAAIVHGAESRREDLQLSTGEDTHPFPTLVGVMRISESALAMSFTSD